MANISESIAQFIIDFLGEQDMIKLSRNELANKFDVSPSQINYVLSTRFGEDSGYIIRSKRGESGYVAIFKISTAQDPYYDIVQRIEKENGLTCKQVSNYTMSMYKRGLINEDTARVMIAATDNRALAYTNDKDNVRKHVFREMLLGLIGNKED